MSDYEQMISNPCTAYIDSWYDSDNDMWLEGLRTGGPIRVTDTSMAEIYELTMKDNGSGDVSWNFHGFMRVTNANSVELQMYNEGTMVGRVAFDSSFVETVRDDSNGYFWNLGPNSFQCPTTAWPCTDHPMTAADWYA